LQQECGNGRGQQQETPIDRGAQRDPDEAQRRGIGFERALDVPFTLQLLDALVYEPRVHSHQA
jgi:hypothetical protein